LRIFNPAQEKLDGCRACDVLGKHVTEVYKLDWQSSLLLSAQRRVLSPGRYPEKVFWNRLMAVRFFLMK
jgi:hypothetical protein